MKTDDQILDELGKASAGLFYLSESDYPFKLIRWDGKTEITPEHLRSVTAEAADSPVEEVEPGPFMGRYPSLAQALKTNLSDLMAYKVGRINMPVYIVGRSPAGNWLGLSTRVVET